MRREDLLLAASSTNPGLDRAAHHRVDALALKELAKEAHVIHVAQGKVRTLSSRGLLITRGLVEYSKAIFLGLDTSGRAFFADGTDDVEDLLPLREIVQNFDAFERLLAAHAVAIMNWHEAHPKCSRCGGETVMSAAGNARLCENDAREIYPRTDSAVIVLVKDRDDRVLLGRQASWPLGRYSTFAGFVEPGESFESAVEREVREECGVRSSEIRYLGSQPWPFPSSIMVAFEVVAEDPLEAVADGVEIEKIAWFSRSEFEQAVDLGELVLPPSISIARRMIEGWYGERVAGGEAWR